MDEDVLAELRAGLTRRPRELPSRLFYDERGSRLFEEITRLPEYYLTRAERALIAAHVPGWIAALRPRSLVELGAGNASKTRPILAAMRTDANDVVYVPIDVSAELLERTAARLREEFPGLVVRPITGTFPQSLAQVGSPPGPVLVTFLGSTIGNFARDDAVDLLRRIRASMRPADRLMIGVDLRKDVATLEAAYNDSRGVTAEFNRNILRVMNERFGANFDLQAFEHRAVYNAEEHRIEMYLVATRRQTVQVPGIGSVELDDSDPIRTEISCKYDRGSVLDILVGAELDLVQWQPDDAGMFALALAGIRSE